MSPPNFKKADTLLGHFKSKQSILRDNCKLQEKQKCQDLFDSRQRFHFPLIKIVSKTVSLISQGFCELQEFLKSKILTTCIHA